MKKSDPKIEKILKKLQTILDKYKNSKDYHILQEIGLNDNYKFLKKKYKFDDFNFEYAYYNTYFALFQCIKLLNLKHENQMELYADLNIIGESLEFLSKYDDTKKPIQNELIFDSIFTYYISGNYPKAYVLTKEKDNLKFPKYREVILELINKNLTKVRGICLDELNNEYMDEEYLIDEIESNNLNEIDAIYYMLSYSIFKSTNDLLNFIYLGEEKFISESLNLIEKYENIALKYQFVDFWWILNILKLLINEFHYNSLWNQLKDFSCTEFPEKTQQYIRNYLNRDPPIFELWPPQIKSIKWINEKNRTNFTIKMPTSSGKTFIAELSILRFYLDNEFNHEKVIYIAPFRALAVEIEKKLKKSLQPIDLSISEFYENYESNPEEIEIIDKTDILVLTPEKFDALLRTNTKLKNNVGLIIFDEGHIIGGNEERDFKTELLMYRLKNMFKDSRFIIISAVLENMQNFSKWISGFNENILESNWQPSRLWFGKIIWNKEGSNIEYISKNGEDIHTNEIQFQKIIPIKKIKNTGKRRSPCPHKNNEALALSSLIFAEDSPTLVFTPTVNETNSVANRVFNILERCDNLNLVKYDNDKDIEDLKKTITSEMGDDSQLLKYLRKGFLIHYRDLPEPVKLKIENVMKLGKINLILSTSTLAQGVNFPLKNIIFKGLYITKQKMKPSTFWNICGRAGRAGQESDGNILLMLDYIANNEKSNENKEKEFKNLLKNYYTVNSGFIELLSEIHWIWRKKYKNKISLEKFYDNIANQTEVIISDNEEDKIIEDKKILEQLSLLDSQLLAFTEENNNDNIPELTKKFIDNSLLIVQKENELENFEKLIKSRLNYLNIMYKDSSRRQMYKLGFNLIDGQTIKSKHDYLESIFLSASNWENFSNNQKIKLLTEISCFILKLNEIKTIKIDKKREIIELWFKYQNPKEIYEKLKIKHPEEEFKINKINKFINNCKYYLPWGFSNILNYLKESLKEKNSEIKIPEICNYFPNMANYGITDPVTSILMHYSNENLKISKEKSKEYYKENPKNKDYDKVINWYISKQTQKDKNMTLENENKIKINNLDLKIADKEKIISLTKNKNELKLYKLNGDYITNIKINRDKNEDTIIDGTIWKIKKTDIILELTKINNTL